MPNTVPSARRGSATQEEGPYSRLYASDLYNGSADAARRLQQAAVRRVVAAGGPEIVYQPQLSLSRMTVEGYEALARFPETPIRGTEDWFARARELGLGTVLEVSAVQRALARHAERPPGTTIAVNVSPTVLISPALAGVLPTDLTGIEIELTEHEWSTGAATLRRELDRLRERGARVAIDDVGTAHSGLRRVIDLAPDKLKLDRALVHGVANSPAKAALVRAVVGLADQIGATVCAEGVETLADLEAVADLDVASAQGWAVGLPDTRFTDAEPEAVRSAGDRLSVMLSGGSAPRVLDTDQLLTRLAGVTTWPELLTLVNGCAAMLGAQSMVTSVLSSDGKSLAAAPTPGRPVASGRIHQLADCPLTRVCLRSRTVVPVYRSPERPAGECEVLQRLGFEAVLMVPVVSRNRVIGLLECYRTDRATWSRRQIRAARTVAAMVGPVLDGLLRA